MGEGEDSSQTPSSFFFSLFPFPFPLSNGGDHDPVRELGAFLRRLHWKRSCPRRRRSPSSPFFFSLFPPSYEEKSRAFTDDATIP